MFGRQSIKLMHTCQTLSENSRQGLQKGRAGKWKKIKRKSPSLNSLQISSFPWKTDKKASDPSSQFPKCLWNGFS